MIANIDFSIFCSPTKAYGNVTGRINVSDSVGVGDQVVVLESASVQGFSGCLRVLSILQPEGVAANLTLSLDDVVLDSVEAANTLIQQLESEVGLFFDPYHSDS